MTILGQAVDGIVEVQDEGSALAFQPAINFVGAGVTVTLDAAAGRYLVTIPAGGVTDHGALTGLADDDHTQYGALAQAETWAALQTFSEGLKLAAAKGIKDSGGTDRVTLATASPHVTLTGNIRLGTTAGINANPNPTSGLIITLPTSGWGNAINITGVTTAAGVTRVITMAPTISLGPGTSFAAIQGGVHCTIANGIAVTRADALFFVLNLHASGDVGAHTVTSFDAVRVQSQYSDDTFLGETITGTNHSGVHVQPPLLLSGAVAITNFRGVWSEVAGLVGMTNVLHFDGAALTAGTNRYGLRMGSVAGGAIAHLLELGAGPTLRLKDRGTGGWTPTAGETPLWIEEGATPTFRQLKTKAFSALLAGDLVCVLA